MAEILFPTFSETDIKVLDSFSEEEIRGYVDFFRDYKEVMWQNGDTKEIVSESELRKMKLHIQPTPQYPDELWRIGYKCLDILGGGFGLLSEEGFFERGSAARIFPCTFYTPTLICAVFADACDRERFCDGLLGHGVRDGRYLKMMLRLQDCLAAYRYFRKKTDVGA